MRTLLAMTLAALKQYRSELVEFKKRDRRRREALAERIQIAESELHDHNRMAGIVDMQMETVEDLIAIREAESNQEPAGGKPEPEVGMKDNLET